MTDIQRLRKLERQLPGSVWYQMDELDFDGCAFAPTRHVEGVERPDSADCETVRVGSFDNAEVAKIVVEIRNALPALLDEVERLRECRKALRIAFSEYAEEYGSASCDCTDPDCWVRLAKSALEATE